MHEEQERKPADYTARVLRGIVRAVKPRRLGWGTCEINGHACTGTVLGLRNGDAVEARGSWTKSEKYGAQFRATTITRTAPSDASGTIAWLAARLPGIGETTARALVERFGVEGVLDAIAHEPEKLCEVRGISKRRAELAAAELRATIGDYEEQSTLLGWGLTESQIKRVRERWGERTLEQIKANPYTLIDEVDGFGFQRADAIARRMGLALDHPSRVEQGVLHVLREAEENGHCFVLRADLATRSCRLLSVGFGDVFSAFSRLAADDRVIPADERVALPSLHRAELRVAACVRELLRVAA